MSEKMESTSREAEQGGLRTWAIVFAISFAFLAWGLFLYATIGDKGPPPWDYSIVQDIPGESPYSSRSQKLVPGGVQDKEVVGQHVKEPSKAQAAPGSHGRVP